LCYFCAVLCRIRRIFCHTPYGRFWHMPCVHRGILAGLSVPKEFSRLWSTVNFVLHLCHIRQILCHAPCGRFWQYAMCTLLHSCGSQCSQGIFNDLKHCEICATFVLFCAVYAEFCATPLMGDSDLCHVYTMASGGCKCSEGILTGLKHREFCAILCRVRRILYHAPCGRFWYYTMCTLLHSSGSQCSLAIFTDLKHRKFCAAYFCAILRCIHRLWFVTVTVMIYNINILLSPCWVVFLHCFLVSVITLTLLFNWWMWLCHSCVTH